METKKIARTYAAVPVVPQTGSSKPFVKFKSEEIDDLISPFCENLIENGWSWESEGELKEVIQESRGCWENTVGTFTKQINGVRANITVFYFFPTWIFRISVDSSNEDILTEVVEDYIKDYEISFTHIADYKFFKTDTVEAEVEEEIASKIEDTHLVKKGDGSYNVYFKESFSDKVIRILDITIYDLYQSSIFLEGALKEWNEKLEDFSSLYEIKSEVKISSEDRDSLNKFMNRMQDLLLELGALEETIKYCSHQVKICKDDIEFYIEELSEEPVNGTGVFESIRNEAEKNVFLSKDLEAFFQIMKRRHQNLMDFMNSKLESKANKHTSDLHAIVKTLGILTVGLLGGLLASSLTSSLTYTPIAVAVSLLVGYLLLRRL